MAASLAMKLKIAQFIDTDGIGGAEVMLLELSAALQARGAEVVVVHFGNDELCRKAADLGIETLVAPGKRFYKKTWSLPVFCLQFASFLRREGFDLVHAHLFGPICGAAPAARLLGLPALGTLHDVYLVKEKPSRGYLLKLAAFCKMQLVSVSRDMRDYYCNLQPNIASTLIYNGADAARYAAGQGNISKEIVSVGRLVSLKCFDLLLNAFALLPQSLDAQLTVVGDGPERDALEALAKSLSLDQRVRFVGEQDDVVSYLQNASVFCLTSETEGLSRSIIEAMSCGLPIVATDVGGNRELVTAGENGVLLRQSCTAREISDALEKLLLDPQQLAKFGAASRARAEKDFSLDAMVGNYWDAYQKLLG